MAPFGHLTTFLFVMFSYYVAEYPELSQRLKRKPLKVLECCNLPEEPEENAERSVNQVLESTMHAISSPVEFFKCVQVSKAYLFWDFFQDKKVESGLQHLISAPDIVERFNSVCNEFCKENEQVQANIQQFVEPEQDSKALTQDEAETEFDMAEANAGGEEVVNDDEENELELGIADANAGDGEVVNDDEENGNGEEADDEEEESTGGSDQMEEDFSQEPDANKQAKTPRRKRRTPGTKKLRSKKKSVVYPKPLLRQLSCNFPGNYRELFSNSPSSPFWAGVG